MQLEHGLVQGKGFRVPASQPTREEIRDVFQESHSGLGLQCVKLFVVVAHLCVAE